MFKMSQVDNSNSNLHHRGRMIGLTALAAVGIGAAYLAWRKLGPSRHQDDDLFSHEGTAGLTMNGRREVDDSGVTDRTGALASGGNELVAQFYDPERVERRAKAAAKRQAALEFATNLLQLRHADKEDDGEEGNDDDENDEAEVSSYKTDPGLEYRIGLTIEGIMRQELLEIVDKLGKLQAKSADSADIKLHQKVRKLENKLLRKAADYLRNSNQMAELCTKHGEKVYMKVNDGDETDGRSRGTQQQQLEQEWSRFGGVTNSTSRGVAAVQQRQVGASYADEADSDEIPQEDEEDDDDDSDDDMQLKRRRRQMLQQLGGGWGDNMDDEDDDAGGWGAAGMDGEEDWMFEDDDDEDMMMEDEEGDEEEEEEGEEEDLESMDVGLAEINMSMFESQLVEHLLRIKESQQQQSSSESTTQSVHMAVIQLEQVSSELAAAREEDDDDEGDEIVLAIGDQDDESNWIDEDEFDGNNDDDEEEEQEEAYTDLLRPTRTVPTKKSKKKSSRSARQDAWIDH